MKTLYHIQWWSRGKWTNTYFGNKVDEDTQLYYFDTLEEAREALDQQYQQQRNAGRKKLTKYSILQMMNDKIIHQYP